MPNPTVPATSEPFLANQPVAARLANIYDILNLILAATGGTAARTPVALTTSAIAIGGTAVTAIAGPINGGFIQNPLNAAAQGIGAAENLYLDMVGVPGSTDAAGNGTTTIIPPGGSFTLPALANGVSVKINAATAGHKVTGEVW